MNWKVSPAVEWLESKDLRFTGGVYPRDLYNVLIDCVEGYHPCFEDSEGTYSSCMSGEWHFVPDFEPDFDFWVAEGRLVTSETAKKIKEWRARGEEE